MKTKSTILGIALSVLSICANAQCPTLTALNVAYTTGSTATITAVSTGTTMASYYVWSVSPSASFTSGGYGSVKELTFPANGSYTVCASINDSSMVCTTTSSCTVINVLSATVGLKEISETISLKTFPNPMGNELTIEVSSKNEKTIGYIFIDALGRIILQGRLEDSKITISTVQLEKGFYSLSITNEKGNILKNVKLLK